MYTKFFDYLKSKLTIPLVIGMVYSKTKEMNRAYVDLKQELMEFERSIVAITEKYRRKVDGLSDKQMEKELDEANAEFKEKLIEHYKRLLKLEDKIQNDIILKHTIRTVNEICKQFNGSNYIHDIEKRLKELSEDVAVQKIKLQGGNKKLAFTPEEIESIRQNDRRQYLFDHHETKVRDLEDTAGAVISDLIVESIKAGFDASLEMGYQNQKDAKELNEALSVTVDQVATFLTEVTQAQNEFLSINDPGVQLAGALPIVVDSVVETVSETVSKDQCKILSENDPGVQVAQNARVVAESIGFFANSVKESVKEQIEDKSILDQQKHETPDDYLDRMSNTYGGTF